MNSSIYKDNCNFCKLDNQICYKAITKVHLNDLKKYGFLDYFAYILYPPNLLVGPIVNYSSFIFQINTQCRSQLNSEKCVYLVISGFLMIISILYQNLMKPSYFYNFLTTPPSSWGTTNNINSFLDLCCLLFMFSVHLIIRYASVLRLSRAVCWVDGIQTSNVVDAVVLISTNLENFVKNWNRSLSDWFERYVYIKLGGKKYKALAILLVYLLLASLTHPSTGRFAFSIVLSLILISELNIRNQIKSILDDSSNLKLALKIVVVAIYQLTFTLLLICGVETNYSNLLSIFWELWMITTILDCFITVAAITPFTMLCYYIQMKSINEIEEKKNAEIAINQISLSSGIESNKPEHVPS